MINANQDTQPANTPTTDRENSLRRTQSVRSVEKYNLSPISFGILDEITNSGKKTRVQKRPSIPVWNDSPDRRPSGPLPPQSPSVYHDASSDIVSPTVFDNHRQTRSSMGLREVTGNERRHSAMAGSPLHSTIRGGRKPSSLHIKRNFDQEEYVDHLENELQAAKEEMYSPNTNQPWKEKLRAAKRENDRLKKEVAATREAFEAELQKTIEHMTATEIDLRKQIISLEGEVEHKQYTIHELENQHEEKRLEQSRVDTFKATIEKLEHEKRSLEDSNRSIAKRNDILTELLAMSPTKSTFGPTSPIRDRRTPRPRSMMILRLPSSPGFKLPDRAHSVLASPAMSATSYFGVSSCSSHYRTHDVDHDVDPQKIDGDARSTESGLGQSCFVPPVGGSNSRRSTIQSQGSTSPSSWGLPLAGTTIGEHIGSKQTSRRKPRRFMTGSTQLKPLLLPTMSDNNALVSPTEVPLPLSPERREISAVSIDPTTSYLLREEESSSTSTYTRFPLELLHGCLETNREDIRSYERFEDAIYEHDTAYAASANPSPNGELDHEVSSDFAGRSSSTSNVAVNSQDSETAASLDFRYNVAQTTNPAHGYDDTHLEQQDLSPCINVANVGKFDLSRLEQVELPSPHYESYPEQEFGNRGEGAAVPEPLFSPFRQDANDATHMNVDDLQHQLTFSMAESPTYVYANARKRRLSRRNEHSFNPPLEGINSIEVHNLEKPKGRAPRPLLTPASVLVRAAKVSTTNLTVSATQSVATPSVSSRRQTRSRSPLEILQKHNLGAQPIASVTIQTIYGTLSRYTSYIRDLKRDPFALARRMIANAWLANWRRLGKLSWWILGIFIRPSAPEYVQLKWDWDSYDGESIAERACSYGSDDDDDDDHDKCSNVVPTNTSNSDTMYNLKKYRYPVEAEQSPPVQDVESGTVNKPGWKHSLYLWGKFSVAIMLAVGGAVVKGPGEMLKDIDERKMHRRHRSCHHDKHNIDCSQPESTDESERLHRADAIMDEPIPANFVSQEPLGHNQVRMKMQPSSQRPVQIALSSSQQSDATKAFRFPPNKTFTFGMPSQGESWNRFDDDGTVKPTKSRRKDVGDIFGHGGLEDGQQEYDPESAGLDVSDASTI